MANWYVRRVADQEMVETIPVPDRLSDRQYERMLRGLLTNLQRDAYYVDTRESDAEIGRAAEGEA